MSMEFVKQRWHMSIKLFFKRIYGPNEIQTCEKNKHFQFRIWKIS